MNSILSVIVPNFNHSKYLPAALDGLIHQTRTPDEIIVVDDASTDDSRVVIEAIAAREPSIRPFFNPRNEGVIASMNRGLAAARGQYVAFAAADDWTEPLFFQTGLKQLEDHPETALFCAEVRLVDEAGRTRGIRPSARPSHRERCFSPEETRRLLTRIDHFIIPLTAVFRRDRLIEAGGFDATLGSMADAFLARDLALRYGFCATPVTVANWRIIPGGFSRSMSRDPDAVLDLLATARVRIERDPIYPAGYADLFERRLRFSTCRVVLENDPVNWDFILRIGARTGPDRRAVAIGRRLGGLGRWLLLTWLTIRLRPFSIVALGETAVRRRLEGLRKHPT